MKNQLFDLHISKLDIILLNQGEKSAKRQSSRGLSPSQLSLKEHSVHSDLGRRRNNPSSPHYAPEELAIRRRALDIRPITSDGAVQRRPNGLGEAHLNAVETLADSAQLEGPGGHGLPQAPAVQVYMVGGLCARPHCGMWARTPERHGGAVEGGVLETDDARGSFVDRLPHDALALHVLEG